MICPKCKKEIPDNSSDNKDIKETTENNLEQEK